MCFGTVTLGVLLGWLCVSSRRISIDGLLKTRSGCAPEGYLWVHSRRVALSVLQKKGGWWMEWRLWGRATVIFKLKSFARLSYVVYLSRNRVGFGWDESWLGSQRIPSESSAPGDLLIVIMHVIQPWNVRMVGKPVFPAQFASGIYRRFVVHAATYQAVATGYLGWWRERERERGKSENVKDLHKKGCHGYSSLHDITSVNRGDKYVSQTQTHSFSLSDHSVCTL